MFHYIGLLCLFSTFVVGGKVHIKKIRYCKQYREQWLNCMLELEGSIQYATTPLNQLFWELANKSSTNDSGPVTVFFQELACALQDRGRCNPFYELWKDKIELLDDLKLNESDLLQLGLHLGNCDLYTQTKHVERYCQQLERQLGAEDIELKQKQKLVQTLYVAAGFVAVLVML